MVNMWGCFNEYSIKLSGSECTELKKYLYSIRESWGDFEVFIKVHPGKIEIINFQKEDDMGGVFWKWEKHVKNVRRVKMIKVKRK